MWPLASPMTSSDGQDAGYNSSNYVILRFSLRHRSATLCQASIRWSSWTNREAVVIAPSQMLPAEHGAHALADVPPQPLRHWPAATDEAVHTYTEQTEAPGLTTSQRSHASVTVQAKHKRTPLLLSADFIALMLSYVF